MLAVLASHASPDAYAQGEGPRLAVERNEDRYTVVADQVEVARALRAVGERAGFLVVDSASRVVTVEAVEVNDASLEVVLGRLLANSNHLIVYRSEADRVLESGAISKIILLSAPDRATPRSAAAVPGGAAGKTSSLAGPDSPGKTAIPKGWGTMRRTRNPPPADEESSEDDEDLEFELPDLHPGQFTLRPTLTRQDRRETGADLDPSRAHGRPDAIEFVEVGCEQRRGQQNPAERGDIVGEQAALRLGLEQLVEGRRRQCQSNVVGAPANRCSDAEDREGLIDPEGSGEIGCSRWRRALPRTTARACDDARVIADGDAFVVDGDVEDRRLQIKRQTASDRAGDVDAPQRDLDRRGNGRVVVAGLRLVQKVGEPIAKESLDVRHEESDQ